MDLVLVKLCFSRKEDSQWPDRSFHLYCNDKCSSGVQPCFLWLLLHGWKFYRCSSGCAHILWLRKGHQMVILSWYTSTSWSLELSWLPCLEQLGCPHSRTCPCLGSFWWLALHPPETDEHSDGCSQNQKGSCKSEENSFTRVNVCHRWLPSVLGVLWAVSCSREGSCVAGSLPAPVA